MPSPVGRRQFNIQSDELVKFHSLPGIERLTAHQVKQGVQDIFWTVQAHCAGAGTSPWASTVLSTEEVLEALAPPPARPDYLELRPGIEAGSFAVTIPGAPGRPERTFHIEPTEWGLRQLGGLVAQQARARAPACPEPGRWVPSEWIRGAFGQGKVPVAGIAVTRWTERGKPAPAVLGADCDL